MKKIILLAAAASLVVMASCKKSGTCTCKYDGEVVAITKYEDSKAKHLKKDCSGKVYGSSTNDEGKEELNEKPWECEWSK